MTEITISIVTYNNEQTIVRSLDSLFAFCPDDISYKVYVIDNGSTDQTIASLARFSDRITLIRSENGNIGFGAAHNLIMKQLDSNMHLIMNPDIFFVDKESIKVLYRYLADHPDVGMAVPEIVDEQGQIQYLCRRELTFLDLFLRFIPGHLSRKREDYHTMKDKDYKQPFDVEFASGCLMAVRTSLFKKLGGFDEAFFLYAEDADFTRRVNQTTRTVYVPQSVVCHAWERASYRDPVRTRIHLKSLRHYFRKWGFRFK